MRAHLVIPVIGLLLRSAGADEPQPTWRGKTAPEWTAVLIKSPDALDRLKAAMALRELAPKSAQIRLLIRSRLADRDETVRQLVAETFGRMGRDGADAVYDLIRALADADPHVRIAAAESLGLIGKASVEATPGFPEAVDALAAALGDSRPDMRTAAVVALGRIMSAINWGPGIGGVGALDVKDRAVAAAAGRVTRSLGDSDPIVRRAALEAIAYFGKSARSAEPALLLMLDSAPDDETREAARKALTWIDGRNGLWGAKSIVYVVDRSGSMSPIFDFVKSELSKAVNKLNSTQNFNIVWFNDGTVLKLSSGLVQATEDNKTRLMRHLNDIDPRGTTDPRTALQVAIEMKPDLIYVLSDGGFEPEFVDEITKFNRLDGKSPTMISCIGFLYPGTEPDKNMKRLARNNRGTYKAVDLTFLGR